MSLPENPRLKSCMVSTVERRALAMFRSVILYCFPFRQKLLTGESQVEPSYDKILETTLLHALTGQSVSSFDRCRFTDWFLSLFFWSSNVMLTVSANFISSAAVWSNNWWWRKNLIFLKHRSLVFLSSWFETFEYSHDLMQKKIAPVHNSAIALSNSDTAEMWSWRMTLNGIAFSWRSSGSSSL